MTDNLQICLSEEADKDKIYLITLATREEILRGEYVEFNGLKLSKNKKKFGLITNIGQENDK